ncbi:MAG: hydantoinase/oxoprolinase family protein, partial [Aquificae bacterium]|nr:hydantoinase/oxoprolinase family protein [Aquificota bacterium]
MLIVGVDTGGTFTDFIFYKNGKWEVLKIPSTPENPAKAVLEGLKQIGEDKKYIVHGTTVATNTLLERKGAKTAFITNKNFEDIVYIGRQNRKELYNLFYKRKKPLVSENLRIGIKGRINSKGEILEDISLEELKNTVKFLKEENVEAVAVSFLFSFLNNEHEKIVEEFLKKEGFLVSSSFRIVPEFREYERASTVIINAYIMPKVKGYISYLEEKIDKTDIFRIMQSNGGSLSPKAVKEEPVRTILSGPAGGVVGAYEIGKKAGFSKLITFDMGGTSTDVSLINNNIPFSTETEISDLPIKVPIIDIHTVGAGGGSIAYIDEGGALNVGPESAGADPGPVCYGKGENITVTDANLFLGRLIPEFFLGGHMKLDIERTSFFIKKLAKKINISPIELAEGIITVANIKMEKAIKVISIEKGYNPSDFSLFSFGGAGGLHAVSLAKDLKIPKVIIPNNPGILSAMGMLMADIIKDYSTTVMLSEKEAKFETLKKLFSILESKAFEELKKEGAKEIIFEKYVDIR